MYSYLFKFLSLALFSSTSVLFYYKLFPFHNELPTGSYIYYYLIPLFLIYGVYKILSLFVFGDEDNKKIIFSYKSLLSYFFLHLFLLCIVFFKTKEGFSGATGIALFFKIIWFLILPTIICLLSYSFGKKIMSYIKGFDEEENTFKLLSSFGLGFFSFVGLIFIFANFGFYNIYSIFLIIFSFVLFSYKEALFIIKDFFSKEIEVENNISLYTSEFLFLVIGALISTNLIIIFRPFPIGWDDLGSYMNTPNLISSAGKMISIGGMQAWELFTGIGYLLGSPTQAFYLNTFSGILSGIIIYVFTKSFLYKKNEFINIPLLLVAIFLSLPMTIFQLGKDMKLDIGLFSVSLIAIYMVYYIFVKKEKFIEDFEESKGFISIIKNYFKKEEFFKKEYYYYMFVVGLIIGFSFAIKFTTLMLLSGILGLIILNRLGFLAFCGFLALYLGFFTKLHLWDMMNVVYPKNNNLFINIFFYITFIFGIGSIVFAYFRHNKDYFKKTFIIIAILLLGFFTALTPWLTKNILESNGKITVSSILSGSPYYYVMPYEKIHTKKEIEEINNKISLRNGLDENGQAGNADFGRYFGYDKGINNYLKLPFNLSMQINQRGEYTDITYIFFALIPAIFLFIPLRKKIYYLPIYGMLLFEILYFIFPFTRNGFTDFFSNIQLPFGYLIILFLFLSGLFFFKFATDWKNDKVLKLFLVNFSFFSFYVFLWNISAYGIVWYGISMYMCFLLFIGIGLYYITKDNNEIDNNPKYYGLKILNFFFIFTIISIYFIKSSLPHIFANFNEDSYVHYKAGIVKQEEGVFAYHGDYLKDLFELNIKDDKKKEFLTKYKKEAFDFLSSNSVYPEAFKNAISNSNDINVLNEVLSYMSRNEDLQKTIDVTNLQNLRNFSDKLRFEIYNNILYPNKEFKSDAIIYRMGTFLKYFVSENNYRLFDDSLIFTFEDYVYNKDSIDKSVENLKKLGLKYLLVDLNTPTIDKDPKHELTNRFEKLLTTFTSDKLELLSSDSVCLRLGIDLYKKSDKNDKSLRNYLRLAGVNYESYENGKEINRNEKLVGCYDTIIYLINNNFINNDSFAYLTQLKNDYLKQNFKNENDKYYYLSQRIPAGFRALLKIK